MDQSGGGSTPPQGQQTPPPPPPQGWQSTPTPPGPPPPTGGQPAGGTPAWTSNLTAQGTIPGPGGIALADTPNRVIAAVIDFIILGVAGFIVTTLTTSMLGDNFGFFRLPSLMSSVVAVVIMLVVSAAYFIGQWSMMGGATIGMKVLKLTVRDATTGGPITQQQAINRWLLFGAPWALTWFYGWGIGFIIAILAFVWYVYLLVSIAQSPSRQGQHDQFAKTVVAKG